LRQKSDALIGQKIPVHRGLAGVDGPGDLVRRLTSEKPVHSFSFVML